MKLSTVLGIGLLASLTAHADPINCVKAKSPTEKTICRNPILIQADTRMDDLWGVAAGFSGMGTAAAMRDDQKAFPARRERCGTDVACIAALYRKQTEAYEKTIEHVRTFGPF